MMSEQRPAIKGIVKSNTQTLERFQNEVLRPILKQQHNLLIQNFTVYLEKRKIDFENLSLEKKEKHIDSILSKDIAFKNMQVGIIVGRFTLEEFAHFTENSNEYSRRILQMLKKRLKDTLL
jgi:superoxide dismutase